MKIRHCTVEERIIRDPDTDERRLTKIYTPSGTVVLAHDGETYTADEHQVFTVPDHVGHVMLGRDGWQVFTGDPDTPAHDGEDRLAAALAEIEELKAALAKSNTGRARSAKKTAGE